jgi:type IV pilus assembly protein PilW
MRVFSRKSISRFTSQQNIKGFTLLELVVASSVALTILGVALGMLSEQRRWMLGDRTRAVSNDNLRLASDLIGQDIKQAGERLEADRFLPSISIEPGSTTQPSALVLQRKLLEQTLPVCQGINASTTTIDIAVMTGTVIDNCEYSYVAPSGGEPSSTLTALQPTGNLRLWRTYRCTQDGLIVANNADPCTATTSSATAWAYIYDEVNQRGEFFQYDLEQQGSCASFSSQTCQRIRRVGSTWKYSYALNTTTPPKLYLFEERRYSLVADDSTSRTDDYILQLSVNRQTPKRIANQVRNFRVWAKVPTSYTSAPFNAPTNWGCAVSGSDAATSPNPDAPNQWYCTTFNFDSTKSEPDQRLTRIMNWQGLQGIRITLTGINPNEQAYKVDETLPNNPLKLSSEFLPRNVASQEN